MKDLPSISVIVPNYNGEKYLKDFLLKNIEIIENYEGFSELIVCDDNSSDDSFMYLTNVSKSRKTLKVITNPNKGACSARNEACRISKGDYLLFIDNDFLLSEGALSTLSTFIDDNIFCIACCINSYFEKKHQQDGVKLLGWKRGFPRFTGNVFNSQLSDSKNVIPSFGVQGACFLCKKDKFNELRGFSSDLFDPYMLEESDLFYRGAKRGWDIRYCPELMGWHKVGGTIASKVNPYTKFLSKRNRFVFVWRNIHSWRLLINHFICLPTIIFKPVELKAFIAAFKMRDKILEARQIEKKESIVSDITLLQRSKEFEKKTKKLIH